MTSADFESLKRVCNWFDITMNYYWEHESDSSEVRDDADIDEYSYSQILPMDAIHTQLCTLKRFWLCSPVKVGQKISEKLYLSCCLDHLYPQRVSWHYYLIKYDAGQQKLFIVYDLFLLCWCVNTWLGYVADTIF